MDELFSVQGKRILATGGTSGIGRMIVQGLAERGAKVFTCSRKQAAVDEVVEALAKKRGFDVHGVTADLSKMEDIKRVAQQVSSHFGGGLDVLINNAGATWGASIDDYPESGWDKVFDLNVKAMFFMTQQCLPMLREAGQRPDKLSRVVNIGSISGIQHPLDGAWAYHPAKAAVHHLTKVMAKQLVNEGVAVNAIAPGFFPSKMTSYLMPEGDESLVSAGIPIGRPGRPNDIIGAVLYLSSQASAFSIGSVIKIDGGSAL